MTTPDLQPGALAPGGLVRPDLPPSIVSGFCRQHDEYAVDEVREEERDALLAASLREVALRFETLHARLAYRSAAEAHAAHKALFGNAAGFDVEHYAYAGRCAAADMAAAVAEAWGLYDWTWEPSVGDPDPDVSGGVAL